MLYVCTFTDKIINLYKKTWTKDLLPLLFHADRDCMCITFDSHMDIACGNGFVLQCKYNFVKFTTVSELDNMHRGL